MTDEWLCSALAVCNVSRTRLLVTEEKLTHAQMLYFAQGSRVGRCFPVVRPTDGSQDMYFRTFLSDKQGPQGGAASSSANKKPGAKADSKGHQPKASPTGP